MLLCAKITKRGKVLWEKNEKKTNQTKQNGANNVLKICKLQVYQTQGSHTKLELMTCLKLSTTSLWKQILLATLFSSPQPNETHLSCFFGHKSKIVQQI